jgi:hypothetical protein
MSEQQQELTRSMNVSYSEPPLPCQFSHLDCGHWFGYFLYLGMVF